MVDYRKENIKIKAKKDESKITMDEKKTYFWEK
jgi:hypothetical protein